MRDIATWGLFRTVILYLEMAEQAARKQRSGKYCRKVCRWIPYTWDGEIRLILEFPLGFSVAKGSAGAKNGDFCRGIRDYLYEGVQECNQGACRGCGGCFRQGLLYWFDDARCGGGGNAG